MAFHEIRFPDDIAYGATGGPEFATTIVTMASGYNTNINWQAARGAMGRSLWSEKTGTARHASGLLSRKKRSRRFSVQDWSEFRATAQLIGTGDGTNRPSARKNYTSGMGSRAALLKNPFPAQRNLFERRADNVRLVNQQLDGNCHDHTAPSNGVSVTADFEFDVPVRFDTDRMAVTIEFFNLHQWSGIPIVEIRV